MKRRYLKINVKRNYVPFQCLTLLDTVDVHDVKSWVGGLEEMKKRLCFEVVLHLYSEWILVKNTIGTQHLRIQLIWTVYTFACLHIFTYFHRFLLWSYFFLISTTLIVTDCHTFVIIFVPNSNQLIQTSSQHISFFRIHLQFDIENHLSLNLLYSCVKMSQHLSEVNFVSFCNCFYSFIRYIKMTIKHLQLISCLK